MDIFVLRFFNDFQMFLKWESSLVYCWKCKKFKKSGKIWMKTKRRKTKAGIYAANQEFEEGWFLIPAMSTYEKPKEIKSLKRFCRWKVWWKQRLEKWWVWNAENCKIMKILGKKFLKKIEKKSAHLNWFVMKICVRLKSVFNIAKIKTFL